MKHWRQDWRWQARSMTDYIGDNTWVKRSLTSREVSDKWVWSVYQVDDSPRYSGVGEWEHHKSLSTFKVPGIARPLPRREKSYRSDYDVLIGEDELVLTSNAWYHEQKSWKHKGKVNKRNVFDGDIIAREIGHNSYTPIIGTDFSSGYEYWKRSSSYWKSVRAVWNEIFQKKQFKLKKRVDDTPLFAYHFQQAEDPKIQAMSAAQQKKIVRELLNKFLD